MVEEWRRKLNGLEESLKEHSLILTNFKWVKAIFLTWNHLLKDISINVLNKCYELLILKVENIFKEIFDLLFDL